MRKNSERKLILLAIVCILIAGIVDILQMCIIKPNRGYVYESIRLIIILIVCYKIYKGKKFVIDIMKIVLIYWSVTSFVGIFVNLGYREFCLVYTVLYSISAYLLIIPKSIKGFIDMRSVK